MAWRHVIGGYEGIIGGDTGDVSAVRSPSVLAASSAYSYEQGTRKVAVNFKRVRTYSCLLCTGDNGMYVGRNDCTHMNPDSVLWSTTYIDYY